LIKIAICDDSKIRLQKKKQYLEYCKKLLPIDWDVFSFEEDRSKEIICRAMEFSVFFIQKDMKEICGIELAKIVRSINRKALIIFMVENEDGFLNILDVIIFNCLVEPITIKEFHEVLEKAIHYIGNMKNKFYYRYFQIDNSIEQEHIIYFEKNKRKVWIHTLTGVKECYMTTERILEQLDLKMFCRSHQSFIVNLNYVEKLTSSFVELINGKKIDVSRTYKHMFRDKYLEYIYKKS